MSTPLIDVDANPRQPDFKPVKEGSKIPSPPKFQRVGNTGRRSPFSVSTTGSPCYTAMPTHPKAVVSPTPTSKLPCKSTPTQGAFSKSYMYGSRSATPRTSLPRARNSQKPAAIAVPLSSNSVRTTPPLSCNKPLPSPPIAQFMNPASPPKAQRTLVDAEAGTPTEEDWPVLQPENVPPATSLALSTDVKLPQRSVSEGSALRRNGVPVLKSRVTTLLSVDNRTPSQMSEASNEDERSGHERFRQMMEPRALSPTNPYAKSFHAFSTDANVAIDSPLAHKQQVLPAVAIPPRISSKRSFLPSPDTMTDEVPTQPSASIRSVKPGCTKWPMLVAADQAAKAQATDETSDNNQYLTTELEHSEPASFDGANITQSHYGSIDSISTWSLAAGSSLDDEAEANYEGTVRVKCLSWHSSNPESGPTLRISADADAVILGRDDFVTAVPALPEHMLQKPLQERFAGTLPGRVSKQVLVNTVPSVGSRTPTPSSTATETTESRPGKIIPIRSMQPPRKPSTGDLSKSPSLGTPASAEVAKAQEVPRSSQAHSPGFCETSRGASMVQHKSETPPPTSDECLEIDYKAGNYSTTLQNEVSQKAMQVLGTDTDAPQSATLKRLPMTWMTPKSATFTLKKSNATRSKTSPSLRSTERAYNRASAISTRSPSAVSSSLAHSTPSQVGASRPGPSRLGITESVAQDLDSILCDNPSKETHVDEQSAADKILSIRAKRSFRNIFGRRDPKATPQPAKKQDSKRSSVAGNALAQRIRNSTDFSKVSLAKPLEVNPESKQDTLASSGGAEALGTEKDRQTALSALESDPAETSIQPASTAQYDTATVIHKILDRVISMGTDSPDRLRGLEIAEAVLHAVKCSKEAKLSAELARKHARDAELILERAGIELKRLEKLCERGFDDETMQAIGQLIVTTGVTET